MKQTRGEPTTAFQYKSYSITQEGVLTCEYSAAGDDFSERFVFSNAGASFDTPAVEEAARILFLLAGVSYYKTSSPLVIIGPSDGLSDREREFLEIYYRHGLAEFAYRNPGVDLSDLRIEAAPRAATPQRSGATLDRPLIPFGGGIDSIVVANHLMRRYPDAALFVANTSDVSFAPIERTAELTSLPIRRVRRYIDSKVLRSRGHGYLNGHVPVTGILSAAAVVSAAAHGHDQVVMSNERSASEPTSLRANGVAVNHQWSKGIDFERGFRRLLEGAVPDIEYYSALRPYSELWVAHEFADLRTYHSSFRSCNRAFYVESEERMASWCGVCDKCCFIDLILSPYLSRGALEQIFEGSEPLQDPALASVFESLVGSPNLEKPLECVGDEAECRTAVLAAIRRDDRRDDRVLSDLAHHVVNLGRYVPNEATLLRPDGPHFIPPAATR